MSNKTSDKIVANAEKRECERIIKLLEQADTHEYHLYGDKGSIHRKHYNSCRLCKRIALIKEGKE